MVSFASAATIGRPSRAAVQSLPNAIAGMTVAETMSTTRPGSERQERRTDQAHRPGFGALARLGIAIRHAPEHGGGCEHLEVAVGAEGEQRQAARRPAAPDGYECVAD